MSFENKPKEFLDNRRKHILSSFGEKDNLEKALSREEFTEKYGVGHDVFTQKDIENFESDVKKKDGSGEDVVKAISEEFKTLTPVLIKGTNNGLEKVYVRESKEEK